jgi:hypothetical protein
VTQTHHEQMTALATRAAERLQGSSETIARLGEEYEAAESDFVFCAVLDSLVFECDCCNNWFEQNEMASDWKCEGCTVE